ncbi:MAG: acyl-CoA/acyl-ACP dehydrogenase [Myxococcota bacterium]|jgi:alkylation response protein AidB-like acyl-CoA dehydrogenase|nr:acyl-CoA/acyl-ACP dehydrogenase [Myxococcota bacterium]
MDFSFSDEQNALREVARKIFEAECTPDRLREIEKSDERFDRRLWEELAKANLLGASLPESQGGSGYGFFELCLLFEEFGRAVAPVPAWATLACAAPAIAKFGTDALRKRWLPGVVAGEAILSAALQEPGNVDPLAPVTTAVRDGDGYRLDGQKFCVPAAFVSERILVPARTGEGVGLFLVDPRGSGVGLERQIVTNREIQGWMKLEGVRVGRSDVLVDPARGTRALAWIVERATTALCATQVGVAERALRITAGYVSERQQFDRPIGSFQAVHTRAADAYIELETQRLTTWQAAYLLSKQDSAPEAVAIAKFFAGEAGHVVTYAAEHLHGGIGADIDYPVHRYYLWSRQIELTLGSSASQLAALGDAIAR